MRVFLRTIADLWGLLVGLFITGRFFFSRKRTVYYPRQVVEPERLLDFRGPIELVGTDADTAIPRCISCMLCVNICPSGCIRVERPKLPKPTAKELQAMQEAEARGEKPQKTATHKNPAIWDYDFTKCSLCGLCVEVCPVKSIRFSSDIYLAGISRQNFHRDLLARLKRLAGQKEIINATGQNVITPVTAPLPPKNISLSALSDKANHTDSCGTSLGQPKERKQ